MAPPVTRPADQAHRLVGHVGGVLSGEHLGHSDQRRPHARVPLVVFAFDDLPAGGLDHPAGELGPVRDLTDAVLDVADVAGTEVGTDVGGEDRARVLLPQNRSGLFEGARRQAPVDGGEEQGGPLQVGEDAAPHLAAVAVLGDVEAVEDQGVGSGGAHAHGVPGLLDLKARAAAGAIKGDDEVALRGDPRLEIGGDVAVGVGDGGAARPDVGDLGERAPHLLAVQLPPTTGLRNGPGVGQAAETTFLAEGPTEDVAVGEARQPLFPLVVGEHTHHDAHHDVVHVVGERDAGVALGQLADDAACRPDVRPHAPEFLRHLEGAETALLEQRGRIVGEGVLLIGRRAQPGEVLRQLPSLLDCLLLFLRGHLDGVHRTSMGVCRRRPATEVSSD